MICIVCCPDRRWWPFHKRGCPNRSFLDFEERGRRMGMFYHGQDSFLAGKPKNRHRDASYRLGWESQKRSQNPTLRRRKK